MKLPGIQKIIDVLTNVDNSSESNAGFDMKCEYDTRKSTDHPCGSAFCIGGHAFVAMNDDLNDDDDDDDHRYETVQDSLAEFCDIPHSIACDLCWPHIDISYDQITLENAINVLEKCMMTGEVDWDVATQN
jgi:hypothetical protein